MSIFTVRRGSSDEGLQRSEITAAGFEIGAIFIIFVIAFTGRSSFGESVKTLLTVLSVFVGGAGMIAGFQTVRRGIRYAASRPTRIVLGIVMMFVGAYTTIHVLS